MARLPDRPDRRQAVLAVVAGLLGPGDEADGLVADLLADGEGVTREELLGAALTRSRAAARRADERLTWEDEPLAGPLGGLEALDDRALLALLDGAGCTPSEATRLLGLGLEDVLATATAARGQLGVSGRRNREALGVALRGPLARPSRGPRRGVLAAAYVMVLLVAGAAGYALVDRIEASTDPGRPRVVTALPLP